MYPAPPAGINRTGPEGDRKITERSPKVHRICHFTDGKPISKKPEKNYLTKILRYTNISMTD